MDDRPVAAIKDAVHAAKMGLFSSKTPEQKQAEQKEANYRRWLQTPAGQARLSRERGDALFQCSIDLAAHKGTIIPMAGGFVNTTGTDPSQVLNQICAEGWELVNGTVVFVPGMQESRDKLMMSGQQVAVSGTTVGYYLFRRKA